MNHFTNKAGWNGIRSATDWLFRAAKPPDARPYGAYFTTLDPATPNLATRLRIPRRKLDYVFQFSGDKDLHPLDGGRGRYVFFSKTDYLVVQERQLAVGRRVS